MSFNGSKKRFKRIRPWYCHLLSIFEVLFLGFLSHDHSINPFDGFLRKREYDQTGQLKVSYNIYLTWKHRSLAACLQLRKLLARIRRLQGYNQYLVLVRHTWQHKRIWLGISSFICWLCILHRRLVKDRIIIPVLPNSLHKLLVHRYWNEIPYKQVQRKMPWKL